MARMAIADVVKLVEETGIELKRAVRKVQISLQALAIQQRELHEEITEARAGKEPWTKNAQLYKKIDYLEFQVRRNNLILFNVPEDGDWEIPDVTAAKVVAILREHLKIRINDDDIEEAHRVGRKKGRKPIVFRLVMFKKKMEILKCRGCLKGTGLYLAEDYSDKVRQDREALKEYLVEAKKLGFHAFLSFNRLHINGKILSIEDLESANRKDDIFIALRERRRSSSTESKSRRDSEKQVSETGSSGRLSRLSSKKDEERKDSSR